MVKQVIIVRDDLDMSMGRIPAQVAHASIAVILSFGKWKDDSFSIDNVPLDIQYWMKDSFVKIVLKVHSEEELNELELKAEVLNLPTAMISDTINKKFEKTALAIGPADSKLLDKITGSLFLL